MNSTMNQPQAQPPAEPLVELILKLVASKKQRSLKQIRQLIYQPFKSRYQPDLFSILPDKAIADVDYYALRQAYRLIGPLMARYPRTAETGNFGRSLGELEQIVGTSVVERKLLIIRQAPKLHLAEPTLLSLVELIQQHNILINWRQIVNDARYWNDRTMVSWYEGLITVRNRNKEAK